jgi:hypothetical protein
MKPGWTLAVLVSLGGSALADVDSKEGTTEAAMVSSSRRGVADDYLVLPSGGELDAQIRFITANQAFGEGPLRFTDLALCGLAGRYSLFSKLEVSARVDVLPKQPAGLDEKVWQSVGVGLRSPLGKYVSLALSGGGGHLISHQGMWTREAFTLEWKKPIDEEFLAFDVQAGVDGLGLQAPNTRDSAFLTEVAVQSNWLFRVPHGEWGAWGGVAYAVPVQHSGNDPTTGIPIDPQPRLDFHAGTVLSLVQEWDLYAEFAVIDRGDAMHPATQLPILDGGFDQKQIVFGIVRHIDKHAPAPMIAE